MTIAGCNIYKIVTISSKTPLAPGGRGEAPHRMQYASANGAQPDTPYYFDEILSIASDIHAYK